MAYPPMAAVSKGPGGRRDKYYIGHGRFYSRMGSTRNVDFFSALKLNVGIESVST
jgi:hypothetical protein